MTTGQIEFNKDEYVRKLIQSKQYIAYLLLLVINRDQRHVFFSSFKIAQQNKVNHILHLKGSIGSNGQYTDILRYVFFLSSNELMKSIDTKKSICSHVELGYNTWISDRREIASAVSFSYFIILSYQSTSIDRTTEN